MNLRIAVDLCKRFEGFRAKPYICPGNVPTIGYGSTRYADGRKVTMVDEPVTKEEAEILLIRELRNTYKPAVRRLCPKLTDEKKFNAILDFTYNLGPGRLQTSTLRRKINAEDWIGAAAELNKWVRGGGRVLPGLVIRRKVEAALLK